MSTSMSLSMGRQLTVGPMLQKSLKLLQMNSIEFARELDNLLDSNPLLELDDAEDAAPSHADRFEGEIEHAPREESEPADAPLSSSGLAESWGNASNRADRGADRSDWMATIAEQSDLRGHLRTQVTDSMLEPELEAACIAVIESLDERGYLDDSPASLCQQLRDSGLSVSRPMISRATDIIRTLDPAGVGARDLADCLSLQLARQDQTCERVGLARRVINDHLELLARGNARAIAHETNQSIEAVRDAVGLIKSLDPTPGREFDTGRVDYIAPELAVKKVGGQWQVMSLSGAMPRVRINQTYADILSQHQDDRTSAPIKEKLQEARWLMRNLEQREQTILSVGKAIVERQKGYFDHGDIALTPMRLADIADDIGMHESTVSRVVSTKYLICPAGLKPMRMFFTSHVHTNAGDACSAAAVKTMIQRLIEAESSSQPLSDHKLASLLARRGVKIARRTVSKYRQALGIRSFELRGEFASAADRT